MPYILYILYILHRLDVLYIFCIYAIHSIYVLFICIVLLYKYYYKNNLEKQTVILNIMHATLLSEIFTCEEAFIKRKKF